MKLFSNYNEWRATITGPCAITLTRSYCTDRIAALRDEKAPGTQPFIKAYGTEYRDQVIKWFQKAEKDAVE